MLNLKAKIKNINMGIKFLSLAVLFYLILLVFNPPMFFKSLDRFGVLALKILPSLLGAFVLIFVFNYLLDNQKIKKYLAGKTDWRKYLLTIALGILSSGPIYVWYPFLADLKQHGFSNGLITIFLYNRAIKIALIPVLVYYFSLQFVILITGLMIVFSVFNGLVLEKIIKK